MERCEHRELGELAIRVQAMPADTNPAGDIFGGWLMSQVDLAGAVIAARRAQGRVATVAVNAFEFHLPVKVGDLVSCYGRLVRIGRTSLTVDVQAFAAARGNLETQQKVTQATLTYVAVDESGAPRPVPAEQAD